MSLLLPTISVIRKRILRWLHFRCRTIHLLCNPLFRTIHPASDDKNDGRLEVHEVYNLDLAHQRDLVVLSVCETAVGGLSAGDEVVGLTRAFMFAGTPSIIATLWNVEDEATALR